MSTGGRVTIIHRRENRWVLFLPAPPCSGSESGIHVSRGLVLDGVMGVSLGEGGRAKSLGPRGGGAVWGHLGQPIPLPTGSVSWAGGLPDLSPFTWFNFTFLKTPPGFSSPFIFSLTHCPFPRRQDYVLSLYLCVEHTAVAQIFTNVGSPPLPRASCPDFTSTTRPPSQAVSAPTGAVSVLHSFMALPPPAKA